MREDNQERHTFAVDAETDNPLALIRSRIEDLTLGDGLTRVQVKLESTQPISVNSTAEEPVEEVESGSTTSQEIGDGAEEVECGHCGAVLDVGDGTEPGNVLRGHMAHCPAKQEEADTEGEDDDLVRFHEDSDAYSIATTLYERRDEGLLELGKVRQFTPNDAGIPDERFSSVLWDLADRGLVEKQPPENDGKQHRYRLTDRGAASVEARMQAA